MKLMITTADTQYLVGYALTGDIKVQPSIRELYYSFHEGLISITSNPSCNTNFTSI